jgi:hypothetical protein
MNWFELSIKIKAKRWKSKDKTLKLTVLIKTLFEMLPNLRELKFLLATHSGAESLPNKLLNLQENMDL